MTTGTILGLFQLPLQVLDCVRNCRKLASISLSYVANEVMHGESQRLRFVMSQGLLYPATQKRHKTQVYT